MEIDLHRIEPWLIEFQSARFNLGESGMVNQTVGELLEDVGGTAADLLSCSLENMDTRGSPALREQIAALYPGLDPDQVLVTTGTSEALLLYYHLRSRPKANIVCPVPAFQSLFDLPRYLGYELRPLQLRPEDRFHIDLDELAKLVDDDTAMIVLNTPHNPTGAVFRDDEVERIFELAEQHGAEVLVDEHYRFLPFGGSDLLPTRFTESRPAVAVGSMIKCMGCVGLRVGWLIGPRSLVDAARDLKDYTTHTVCSLNDKLAELTLRKWRDLMPRYREWVLTNTERFARFVDEHPEHIEWVRPEGGMVCFPRLKSPRPTTEIARELVQQKQVFILPGETFDMPHHARVGFGLEPSDFDEAMNRWSAFLNGR